MQKERKRKCFNSISIKWQTLSMINKKSRNNWRCCCYLFHNSSTRMVFTQSRICCRMGISFPSRICKGWYIFCYDCSFIVYSSVWKSLSRRSHIWSISTDSYMERYDKVLLGTILLLGGSFAMAKGVTTSGLSYFFGEKLKIFENMPQWLFISFASLMATILTQFS